MKQQLKIKIKQNLENLKYSTGLLKRKDANDQPLKHPYKWNHKPSQNCTRHQKQTREPRIVPKLNTNLQAIIPDFEGKRQNILEQLKSQRIAKIERQSTAKCLDLCDSHPTKSDPNKMKKIEAMIRKNVEKLKERDRMHRLKNEEARKVKQAKLRAIDLKCKQLVGRAKKYDSDLRSSFHASADHFSTFSELREANNVRKSQRQLRKRAETELEKQLAEQAIFENLQGEDQEPRKEAQKPTDIVCENKGRPIQQQGASSMAKINSKDTRNSVQKKPGKQKELQSIQEVNKTTKSKADLKKNAGRAIRIETLQEQKEVTAHKDTFNEFINDALIKAPKKIKQEDKTEHKKRESKNKFNAKEEEAKKKKLSRQIERKKQQIVSQYKKQNAVAQNIESRNKKLREQYESKLAVKKVAPEIGEQVQQPRDLYSSKYEIQPEGDVEKMMIHGDPLMHEHERKTKINKAKKAGEKRTDDIFTADLKTLLGRAQIKF